MDTFQIMEGQVTQPRQQPGGLGLRYFTMQGNETSPSLSSADVLHGLTPHSSLPSPL
jgi:hypothetical protein